MIVIIDHYDSFTYNLYQYITEIAGEVLVFRHDQVTVKEIEKLSPSAIVLSPGPGNPNESGISKGLLEQFYQKIPILGICLGHQVIVEWFGGKVQKGKQPVHGKTANVTHDGQTIFRDIPNPTTVTRYHSLVATTLPSSLKVTARSEDGAVMAVRHNLYPIEGIQFHPESILTEHGYRMLKNFFSFMKGEDLDFILKEVER
ncbi:aminodeoxychorismate/anthranilate synthase component II [Pontibacillus sp. HMF3514]|uniref:anthranilate synthase component II n=1 Tax=Pontibacillus sp. HMF3514 TaxID=2692425 RepID=UPI00131F878C|nr:aminodeoxychorismate/anthranilate synthase component II [Pontibacillus sp. HMF3514]QHE52615.1 anthranilate/aminodeoxychorismate synthase component II [Pontibacillus sp. HMF3514]